MDNYFIKPGYLVKDDPNNKWDPLTLSSWYNDDVKESEIEKEYLNAYLNASKDLQIALVKRTHIRPGMTVFRIDQTCLPFLFSCRHLIELTIKFKLKELNMKYRASHNLNEMWRLIKDIATKKYDAKFDDLINTFNYTDKNGVGLRYSHNTEDKLYDKGPVSINSDHIIEYTEKLYNYIIDLKGSKNEF